MPRPIAISLSPNTEAADIRQAWRVLKHPSVWQDTSIMPEITSELSSRLGHIPVSITSSGRQALYLALQALGIGQGDEVITQAFTCIAVPEPIVWVGAKPVYADIVPGTYNINPEEVRKKITAATKAIIVQHTFGIPADIEKLHAIAKEHGITLIEDCAHALGGTLQGKPLGTFGDIAIFSFGRDKTISSVFGGAIATPHEAIIRKVIAIQKALPLPPAWWVTQQLLHPILFSVIVPRYFLSGIGKGMLVTAQKMRLLSKAVATKERQGRKPNHVHYRFSPALGRLLLVQLRKIDAYTKRRRHIAGRYMREISNHLITMPVAPSEAANPAWLRFPIETGNPSAMHEKARLSHMLLGDWYNAPLVPGGSNMDIFQYQQGMCPHAENASSHIVNLPTYPLLSDEQIHEIILFVNTYRT